MKTATEVPIGGSAKTMTGSVRSLFVKVAKFVDDLVVRYYYKGEWSRPEVRERLEKVAGVYTGRYGYRGEI